MNKKLGIVIASLLLIVVFVIAIPLSFESSLGEQTLPDSIMYEVEILGESIKCSLTFDRKSCLLELADEREREAAELQKKRNLSFDKEVKERYSFMIIAANNAASRLRIEALGNV